MFNPLCGDAIDDSFVRKMQHRYGYKEIKLRQKIRRNSEITLCTRALRMASSCLVLRRESFLLGLSKKTYFTLRKPTRSLKVTGMEGSNPTVKRKAKALVAQFLMLGRLISVNSPDAQPPVNGASRQIPGAQSPGVQPPVNVASHPSKSARSSVNGATRTTDFYQQLTALVTKNQNWK